MRVYKYILLKAPPLLLYLKIALWAPYLKGIIQKNKDGKKCVLSVFGLPPRLSFSPCFFSILFIFFLKIFHIFPYFLYMVSGKNTFCGNSFVFLTLADPPLKLPGLGKCILPDKGQPPRMCEVSLLGSVRVATESVRISSKSVRPTSENCRSVLKSVGSPQKVKGFPQKVGVMSQKM